MRKHSFQRVIANSLPRLFIRSEEHKATLHTMSSPVQPTKRNIEIKARIHDEESFEKRISIAKNLTKIDGVILNQHDVFFNVSSGRLKLRMQDENAMLVQYHRPDISGPKLSEFNVLEIAEPKLLLNMLESSLGILGEVKKTRFLFLHDQTRIHLDKVDGLGTFLEFEVCLRPDETVEHGTAIANKLMEIFQIKENDLLTQAYMDELLQK